MPDPAVTVALLLLIALVEASPIVRLPLGLLLAIAMLASGAELLPIALIGAAGVTLARLALALAARRARDGARPTSPAAQAQREALRRQLAGSRAYARTTFVLAALPGIPASFVFPLLGAMRAPLWPALAGTLVGRTPVLALTTALFAWLGRIGDGTDEEAAVALGVLAALLLVLRSIGMVDWQHRAETGRFRMKESGGQAMRVTTLFADTGPRPDATRRDYPSPELDGADVVEGELLGEEIVDDDSQP